MIQILPVASPLHGPGLLRTVCAQVCTQLDRLGVPARVVAEGSKPVPGEPAVVLVVTGGTEHRALAALQHVCGPAVLLAYPEHNSLPASLEILARLRQLGRRGKIILLNGRPDGVEELLRTLAGLTAWGRLASMRMGRVGVPSEWLVASTPSPEIVREAWGCTLVDVPMAELVDAVRSASHHDAEDAARDMLNKASGCVEPSGADVMDGALVLVGLRAVVQRYRLDAFAIRCFDLVNELKTTGCMAVSQLMDDGVIAGCEGDVPATLTMAWMHACTGQIPFMANPQDLDVASRSVWLAHCTVARSLVDGHRLRSHFESSLGVAIEGRLRNGPITLARMGGPDLRQVFIANGEVVDGGDCAMRCRTQVKVQLETDPRVFLEAPLGNHHVLVTGHWATKLQAHHALHVAG